MNAFIQCKVQEIELAFRSWPRRTRIVVQVGFADAQSCADLGPLAVGEAEDADVPVALVFPEHEAFFGIVMRGAEHPIAAWVRFGMLDTW